MAFFDFLKSKPAHDYAPDYSPHIQAALDAFSADTGDHWKGVVDDIARRTGDEDLAMDLFRFLPIAYTRLLLPDVQLADHYRQVTAQGGYTEHKFADNPLYVQIAHYLETHPLSKEETDGLLGYNSEIAAINQALHAGSQLEDLIMAPPMFT